MPVTIVSVVDVLSEDVTTLAVGCDPELAVIGIDVEVSASVLDIVVGDVAVGELCFELYSWLVETDA